MRQVRLESCDDGEPFCGWMRRWTCLLDTRSIVLFSSMTGMVCCPNFGPRRAICWARRSSPGSRPSEELKGMDILRVQKSHNNTRHKITHTDSGPIVLVMTAQSGHGPFCSLAVLLSFVFKERETKQHRGITKNTTTQDNKSHTQRHGKV